jgi:Domain of unknown function (DUF3331)
MIDGRPPFPIRSGRRRAYRFLSSRFVVGATSGGVSKHVDRKEKFAMDLRLQRRSRVELHAWSHTLASLAALSLGLSKVPSQVDGDRLMRTQTLRHMAPSRGARAKVRILDRPSKNTAVISWLDSTMCCYGDHLWRPGKSRRSGTCALKGCGISPGDSIYHPRNARPSPLNANAMILACHLEDSREYTSLPAVLSYEQPWACRPIRVEPTATDIANACDEATRS